MKSMIRISPLYKMHIDFAERWVVVRRRFKPAPDFGLFSSRFFVLTTRIMPVIASVCLQASDYYSSARLDIHT
jgi:hypothetical protein